MGNYTGDHYSNSRGDQLYNWIQRNNLIVWNSRLCFGQPTYMTYQGSSIIDYFLSIIRSDLSLDSNHKLMTLSFDIARTTTGIPREKRIAWRLGRLKSLKLRSTITTSGTTEGLLGRGCKKPTSTEKDVAYWLKNQEAHAALWRLIQKRRKENWEHFCQQLASRALLHIYMLHKDPTNHNPPPTGDQDIHPKADISTSTTSTTSASIWQTFRAYSKLTKSQVITAFEDKEAKATSRQKRNERLWI
ncbi:hypothetical protein RO3G_04243 [Rhizopus delemar RA 99-880]|uniref:Endonuclease/exonuclease/phosphatase domain-containing protein n=1 Tax=Rhizopus delemar (strain RA 99-880 / ATCC MYA-4621 / FGSC 9543 / NRRL 43880) TaxID=246409 RepID=I1BTK8_RHIO9|nr:hypothetical protein RO3G_04243 [Rhizopus delemar RA 99-880]|eukprot:EIE79538.1 hypothetical protein RO3G_04243 [Rhizopus delemar RA 99-880]